MRETEIPLPAGADCETVARAIDRGIADAGLQTTRRGTLKKYPGCIHWHVKHGRESGTLEITLWPDARRAWFSVQSGRAAPWIDESIVRLSALIEHGLHTI